MPSPSPDIKVFFADDQLVLSAWSNLVVTEMLGTIRLHHIPEITKIYKSMSPSYPDGLLALTLIPHGIHISDLETRKETTRALESLSSAIRQISVVLEGTGIWAGTMRTVLRGMSVMARSRLGMQVFGDVREAAASMAPMLADVANRKPTERDLLDAVARMRAAPQRAAAAR